MVQRSLIHIQLGLINRTLEEQNLTNSIPLVVYNIHIYIYATPLYIFQRVNLKKESAKALPSRGAGGMV